MLFHNRFRYQLLLLIVLLAIINYIDRGAIAYASKDILQEYGFNKQDWGKILGYFGFGYMFGALTGGPLSDKYGPKRIWLVAGVSWSIFEMLTSWSGDFGIIFFGSALTGFAIMRIIFGFAEGPTYSIINKTVSNWATSKERGFALSLGMLSVPIGAMITAPIAVSLLLVTNNWRLMFIILGIISLIALYFLMKYLSDHPRDSSHIRPAELEKILKDQQQRAINEKNSAIDSQVSWTAFFKSRTLLCNTIGYASFLYVTFLILTWTPKYLQDQFHFDLKSLWYLGMTPWIGACFTVVFGGYISDVILRKTQNKWLSRSGITALSLLITSVIFFTIPHLSSPVSVLFAISIANAFNFLPNAVYWAVVIDTLPQAKVGKFSGIMHFFANISSVAAPALTGYLVTVYNDYSPMFVAAGIMSFIGMLAMLLVQPGKIFSSSKIMGSHLVSES